MKLLIVTQYFWPETFIINDLATALVEQGHQVTVLTGIPNYPQGKFYAGYHWFKPITENYNGVVVKRVPLISRGKNSRFKLVLNYLSYCISATVLGAFFCREKYDAIFVYQLSPVTVGIPGVVLKYLRKTKLFFWIQDLWPETLSAMGFPSTSFIYRCVNKLTTFIYKHCDKILIQCKGFEKSLSDKQVPINKILYFPNWVPSIYQPVAQQNAVATLPLPQGFLVMFAGNLGVAQSFETILDAAEKLRDYPDIHWIILGDGRQADWIKATVMEKQLQNNVHMLGHHAAEMMPYYFAQANVMLVTLKCTPAFAITIPTKILSYFMTGKPVIGALDGFGADFITEAEAGFAGPAEDSEALVENILKAYQLPAAELIAMGQTGLAYAKKHFERERLIEQLTQWMSEC